MLNALISPISNVISSVASRIGVDKDLAAKLQNEVTTELLNTKQAELKGAVEIIVAEAKGESWLQRNWRPLLMVSITCVIVNNYLIFPYLHVFGLPGTMLNLPDRLFSLMEIGVGGYIVGRTGEKLLKTWKE